MSVETYLLGVISLFGFMTVATILATAAVIVFFAVAGLIEVLVHGRRQS